jgi:hypothetical protein
MNFTVFSTLQLKNSSAVNFTQAISYILAFITLFGVILFPFWISKTTKKFLDSKNTSEKETFMEKYGVLFEIFEEQKFLQSGFFMIITIKRILFSFNLVILNYNISTS